MQFLRRSFLLLLCAALLLCGTACSNNAANQPTQAPDPVVTDAPVETPAPPAETPAPTPVPTPEPTEDLTEYVDVVGLDEHEQEFIDALTETGDLVVITDEDYVDIVTRLQDISSDDDHMPFQLQGVLVRENGTVRVMRTIVNGTETYELGLYLTGLNKPIADGAWVDVMGLVMMEEINGQTVPTIQILSIQALEEHGQSELTVG